MRQIERLGAARRAALATAAAGCVISLAACGSQGLAGPAASAGQPAKASLAGSAGQSVSADGAGAVAAPNGSTTGHVALCADIPRLTSVMVSPAAVFRDVQKGPILPRGIPIMKPGVVRSLAAALCGLPPLPPAFPCPIPFGSSLRFGFAAGVRSFPPVSVQAIGCRVVTGLGPPRTARSAAFWRTLDTDLGGLSWLPSPNASGGIRP